MLYNNYDGNDALLAPLSGILFPVITARQLFSFLAWLFSFLAWLFACRGLISVVYLSPLRYKASQNRNEDS